MARRMLITGATGFIGSRLIARAGNEGYRIRTLTRRDWIGPPVVPSSERFFAAFPIDIPVDAFDDTQVVVHCAAQSSGSDRVMHAINVETTVSLATLARARGVESFVFLSSQSAHPEAISSYGRTKFLAEQELMKFEPLKVVILRPGLVVGPGSDGLYGRIQKLVRRLPVIPVLSGGSSIVQPIHVD